MKAARSKSKTLKLRINGKGPDLKLGMKEGEGKIIYITTNIYLTPTSGPTGQYPLDNYYYIFEMAP